MQHQSHPMLSYLVSLTVVSGPDTGMTRSFRQRRVTMGRDPRSDFVLSDGYVSNRHAEIELGGLGVFFRDLESRHGSTVLVDGVATKLRGADSVQLTHGVELQVGSTLIRVGIGPAAERSLGGDTRFGVNQAFPEAMQGTGREGEHFITTAHLPVQSLDQKSLQSADARFGVLFRLAGQLNGQTTLDDVLELILEATFDAFPAANFFAITLGSDPDEVSTKEPFLTRARGAIPRASDDDAPLLSTSILRRVAETQESVLFVKDSLGTMVSQSILDAKITACLCAPLVGQNSLLGIMQVDTRGLGSLFGRHDLELFNILASNVAFAIERARLTESIVEMFEGFVAASVNAVEARDPVTAGHSERVALYTVELAKAVNEIETGRLKDIYLNPQELTELRYAALLHDFGKIAVREDVLQKEARLPQTQMRLIYQRFETIKERAYSQWLHEHLRQLQAGEVQLNGSALARIDSQYESFCKELDELYEWLHFVSAKGFLEDQEIERIIALGARTYVGPQGTRFPYLTPVEVENLCIRKGTLNEAEWVEMRSHAALSEAYLAQIPWSDDLARIPCIAGAHHEKLDGSGYPKGLGEEMILPQVRMLTIADIFDALTASDRPYRKAAPAERAFEILGWEAEEKKLDKDLVEVFGARVIPRIKEIIPRSN